MGEETIKKVLKNSGLTEKEAEIYIFLARKDTLTGTEVAKSLKKDNAQVFRLLKKLQAKGFLESTLEYPKRYIVVPFDNILNRIIKARQEEVAFIQKSKKDLVKYLKKKRQSELDPSLERFVVVKGNKRIYSKINQIIHETKHELSVAITLPDLIDADRFGVLDAAFHQHSKSQIKYRFLMELPKQNLNALKLLLERVPEANFNRKARIPDLGLKLFPRMIARDNEEILLFTMPKTEKAVRDDVCLWTNCKTLVKTFTTVFEDLWNNSTDLQTRIMEIETGKPTPKTQVIDGTEKAYKKINETIRSAENEIILMTSSEGLIESWKNIALLKERIEKGVAVKIMAPITKENFQAAQELLKCCQVRHVPTGYFNTVIVDGKRVFQSQASTGQKPSLAPHFYTDDLEYVEKTKHMLIDVWRSASVPSAVTLDSFMKPSVPSVATPEHEGALSKPDSPYKRTVYGFEEKQGVITEKDVLNKIINAKKYPVKGPKDTVRFYGSAATAVIHPPKSFNLPDIMIMAFHWNKQSSFGGGDLLFISLRLKTPKGYAFVPVVRVSEDAKRETKAPDFGNAMFAGTPAGQNLQLVKKDELQIRFHGNIFFAGWAKPIPLIPSKFTLPPAFIQLEGYSKLGTSVIDSVLPSGAKVTTEVNGFDAFVTFFHPASKYFGPGTDGTIGRDMVVTIHPQ